MTVSHLLNKPWHKCIVFVLPCSILVFQFTTQISPLAALHFVINENCLVEIVTDVCLRWG